MFDFFRSKTPRYTNPKTLAYDMSARGFTLSLVTPDSWVFTEEGIRTIIIERVQDKYFANLVIGSKMSQTPIDSQKSWKNYLRSL